MKKILVSSAAALAAMLLFSGCVGLDVGGGTRNVTQKPTVGQQLLDLQKARDSGAISDVEYHIQKEKILHTN